MSVPDVLPDARARETKGRVTGPDGTTWVPIFCVNCGKPQGGVPEGAMTFVCWICDDCVEKHGPPPGCYLEPDEVFWQKVHAEMMEKYGRILDEGEIAIEIDRNPDGLLAMLSREAPKPR